MASKKKTDQTVHMATVEQIKQLIAIVVQAIPVRITHAQAQYWIGHGKELAVKVKAIFQIADPFRDQVTAWETFYRYCLDSTIDLSNLQVPNPKPGFNWLIIVVPGVTIKTVISVCANRFPVYSWANKDPDEITESVRFATTEPYAVWVRDRVEADEEHQGKSHSDLLAANVNGITLLEYLLLHLKHFTETDTHLDAKNITLCSGSLVRNGGVPCADWNLVFGRLYVDSHYRGYVDVDLRSREVVV